MELAQQSLLHRLSKAQVVTRMLLAANVAQGEEVASKQELAGEACSQLSLHTIIAELNLLKASQITSGDYASFAVAFMGCMLTLRMLVLVQPSAGHDHCRAQGAYAGAGTSKGEYLHQPISVLPASCFSNWLWFFPTFEKTFPTMQAKQLEDSKRELRAAQENVKHMETRNHLSLHFLGC